MKRLLVLLCVLALAGCSNADGGKGSASPSSLTERPIAVVEGSSSSGDLEVYDPWGVVLTAKDVTPTGLTIVCTQSGGEDVAELMTGQPYHLEVKKDGSWENYPAKRDDIAWTMEGWMIALNGTTEWSVGWSSLYGKLPAGTYRIAKEIMNFRGPGDYDEVTYYAEFTIE